jgi:hypothetical protein
MTFLNTNMLYMNLKELDAKNLVVRDSNLDQGSNIKAKIQNFKVNLTNVLFQNVTFQNLELIIFEYYNNSFNF